MYVTVIVSKDEPKPVVGGDHYIVMEVPDEVSKGGLIERYIRPGVHVLIDKLRTEQKVEV